jgi:hypothetical protein
MGAPEAPPNAVRLSAKGGSTAPRCVARISVARLGLKPSDALAQPLESRGERNSQASVDLGLAFLKVA